MRFKATIDKIKHHTKDSSRQAIQLPLDQDSRLQSLLVKALGSIVPAYKEQEHRRRERERREKLVDHLKTYLN